MDLVQSAFVTTAIVAVTEFIKRLNNKDWEGAAIIFLAAAIGFFAGLFNVENLNVVTGIVAGLAAVGVHTVGTVIGSTTNVSGTDMTIVKK